MNGWWNTTSRRAGLCGLWLSMLGAGTATAGVHVALVPNSTTVAPGAAVEVRIEVTQAGDEFNTYQAVVGFDPAALTFVQSSPLSLQEGPYMTGACGSTFHWFTSGTTQVGMVHSILCANQVLTGPGALYVLHFTAIGNPRTTTVTFAQVDFARAGIPVTVSGAADATIRISSPSDAATPQAPACAVQVAPNPFNPTTTIRVEAAAGTQSLQIFDLRGQLVRSLSYGEFPAGQRTVVWDGRGADGARLASGVYLVVLRTASHSATQRVVLLK